MENYNILLNDSFSHLIEIASFLVPYAKTEVKQPIAIKQQHMQINHAQKSESFSQITSNPPPSAAT